MGIETQVASSDKCACIELIQSWGLFRDQGRWAELLETFVPEGVIAVSWFEGPFAEFVERCRTRDAKRTGCSKLSTAEQKQASVAE